jgi:methionyl-tRNA formyltransferase
MSYDQIFKEKILSYFGNNIINCHAGLLPSYRGRNVLNWVIINGEKKFGITVHVINQKIDQGDILNQKKYIIKKNDDYGLILKKSYKECPKILYDTIKKIQGKKITPKSQSKLKIKPSFFKKRALGDEYLDLNQKSYLMQNFIKGLVSPGPYARIKTKNNEIKIIKSSINKRLKNNYKYKVICKIKNNKFYLNTIDKKTLCIEQWSAEKKFVPELGVRFL